ncbi:glycosyltransferase, partial [Candidatus Peregrinibacteria bacterium]|nr:glycosyltransferase [Candidatus Peregrinibacteria bacterium]
MSPLVSAIVLNYRTPQDAVRCTEALMRQTIADALEIFVVDNHSCDDSIGVIRNRLTRFPSVHILESPRNAGYARGNALALTRAGGKYLLI